MTGERRIPRHQVSTFMRALAKRARRRVRNGWRPTCEERIGEILCGDPATHVDYNMRPLCDLHAAGVTYAERI